MQEFVIKLHEMLDGDMPEHSGYYLMASSSPDGTIGLESMWWDSDEKAWRSAKWDETILVPTKYWGHIWGEDVLTGKVEVIK